jgi:transposase
MSASSFLIQLTVDEKKERQGRRRRLKGSRGRGTLEKEKPPVLGMLQRNGEVAIKMLANVQQKTIEPFIKRFIAKGSLIYTDEYCIYLCPTWGMTA